jgi:hypothetical protein
MHLEGVGDLCLAELPGAEESIAGWLVAKVDHRLLQGGSAVSAAKRAHGHTGPVESIDAGKKQANRA